MDIESSVKLLIEAELGIDYNEITPQTGPENSPSWDSFGQFALISAVEEKFKITFEFDEIFQVNSAESLINITKSKLSL